MKNKILAAITAAVLSVGAFSAPFQSNIGAIYSAEAAQTVATPKCSRASGKYYSNGNLKITLSCSTSGATIYYSTNGGSSYKRYTKALYITKNTSIKFYAVKSGVKSKVVTRTFKLLPKFNITPDAGSYDGKQTIRLSSGVPGLKFYYTLDGSTPTTKSTLYTAKGIVIDKDCTLRIRTAKSGWNPRTISKTFTINTVVDEQPTVTVENESILENYTQKYYYNTLNEKQQQLYKLLYDGVASHKSQIDITSLECNANDVETAFYAMDYDNPQFFWLDSGYTYSYITDIVYYVDPNYTRSKAEAEKIRPNLEAAAEKITSAALELPTLFERIKYFHDSIVNGTDYVLQGGEFIQDADGVLLNGKALCEGYSKAFAYLCQSIGIDCICVIGNANGSHMWNMVKLDGSWYHMDVTFDDPVSDVPTCTYTYFCITEKEISDTHKISKFAEIPPATATKYNYYNAMGIEVHSNAQQAYNQLISCSAKNYLSGIDRTEVVCTDTCVKALHSLTTSKGAEIFDDLEKLGCCPSGLTRGYSGTIYYFKLS